MALDYTFDRRLELEREYSKAEGQLWEQVHMICRKLQREKPFEQIYEVLCASILH